MEVLDTNAAERIYRELYKTLGKAIGFQMARNIIKMGEDGFNREAPVESLSALNKSLISAFGKTTAKVMLSTSVKSCFDDEKAQMILGELTRLGIISD